MVFVIGGLMCVMTDHVTTDSEIRMKVSIIIVLTYIFTVLTNMITIAVIVIKQIIRYIREYK